MLMQPREPTAPPHFRRDVRNLGAAPPRTPTLLRDPPTDVEAFKTVRALATRIKALRKGRPLRLQMNPHTRHMGRVFPAIDLFVVDGEGNETWIGCAAVQSHTDRVLRDALEAVDPQLGAA